MAHDQPPLGQDRLYQILGLMNEQIELVQEQVAGNATNAGGIQLPIFSGSPSEDVNEWLETFNRFARFRRWINGQQRCVYDVSRRDSQTLLSATACENLERLQQAVQTGFTTADQNFLMRQELNARHQGATEPLERYIADIDAKGQRLQLTDMEITQCFMQGLRDDLKEHVVLQRPNSFLAAANAARLKDSLRKQTTSSIGATLASLLSQLNTDKSKSPSQPVNNISRFRGKSFVKSKMNSIDFKISVTSSNATTKQEMERYVTIVISLGILLVDVTVIQQMLLDKTPPTQRQLEDPLVHAISIMIAHGPTMQNLRERLSHLTQLVLPREMTRLTHVFHRRHPHHHPSVCCRHLMMYHISTNLHAVVHYVIRLGTPFPKHHRQTCISLMPTIVILQFLAK